MENKNITILGNNQEYEDWDIQAIVFLEEEKVIEYMKEYFLLTVRHKMVHPIKRDLTLFYCYEFDNFKDWSENNVWFKRNYYVYDNIMISQKDFLPTGRDDAEEDYGLIDRDKFLEFLKERGIVFFLKNEVGNIS